jgi:hypothetical protein
MADEKNIQSEGRDANGAQPLNASDNKDGPERYPSVRQDDSVDSGAEQRSFDPSADAPTPRQGAGDGGAPASANEGRIGPGGDPAEGKR